MLVFPLKKEWYEKIKSGEKTVEYREIKPYWEIRIFNEYKPLFANYLREIFKDLDDETIETEILYRWRFGNILDPAEGFTLPVILRNGYGKEKLTASAYKIKFVKGLDTDLHIDETVYAIYLKDVREV